MEQFSTEEQHNLLVVGPSWVGDMVMAQSLLKKLRHLKPHASITVMAPAWSRALLDRMPEVDGTLESPFDHGDLKLWARYQLGRGLSGRFDTAIVLPNSFKSALVPYFAGIRQRRGWRGEMRNLLLTDCRTLDEKRYPLMVERFVALALPEGAAVDSYERPCLTTRADLSRATAESLGIEPGGQVLALCPGAEFGEAKQWPLSHYAQLCDMAAGQGWQIWIMGSPNDRQTGSRIWQLTNESTRQSCLDLTGKTSLAQAIDLLSLATATVTNDSGLMHIAAAVGSPLVALYGSTSPDFTPPLADRVESLFTDIDCRPCFARQCPLGHKRCLTEISPQRVFDSMQSLSTP